MPACGGAPDTERAGYVGGTLRAGEKFLKGEFLAENGGKQPMVVEPSQSRRVNKSETEYGVG